MLKSNKNSVSIGKTLKSHRKLLKSSVMFDFSKLSVLILAASSLVSFVSSKSLKIDNSSKIFFQVLSQQEGSQAECDALMNSIENWSDCCSYPRINIPDDIWYLCEDMCPWEKNTDECCFNTCYQRALGLYTPIYDAQGNFSSSDFTWTPLFDSLMSYVKAVKEIWEPVVHNVVNRCFDQFGGIGTDYLCGVIPKGWDDMVHCTIKQEILQCPFWNPHGLLNCSYNIEWLVKCW